LWVQFLPDLPEKETPSNHGGVLAVKKTERSV